MTRAWTRREVAAADRTAVDDVGLPTGILMENAGAGLAGVTIEEAKTCGTRTITVLAHRGSNGGDGLVAARHLLVAGLDVTVVLTCARGGVGGPSPTWRTNLRAAEACGARVVDGRSVAVVGRALRGAGRRPIVVDALLGTGLARAVTGHLLEVLGLLAAHGGPIVAADLPSGLDADTGELLGPAPRCVATATFLVPKRGLLRGHGPAHAGRIVVCPIGVPPSVVLPRRAR